MADHFSGGTPPESEREATKHSARIVWALGSGIVLGGLNHLKRYFDRKCPHCGTAWARDKNGYIRTLSDNEQDRTYTETETRESGSGRRKRTKDIIEIYRTHVYYELRDCLQCGEESTGRRKDKTQVRKVVTATTPWQRD